MVIKTKVKGLQNFRIVKLSSESGSMIMEEDSFGFFYIIDIEVNKKRHGLGTRLLKEGEAQIANLGGIVLVAQAEEHRTPGVSEFYKQNGFKEVTPKQKEMFATDINNGFDGINYLMKYLI